MISEIYSVLLKNKRCAHSTYRKLLKIKGLWCTILLPVEKESIFGLEDLVEYDELASKKVKLLVFGLFQEGEKGFEGYDSFVETFILTPFNEKLPLQTCVQVEFLNRKFNFKVDTHRNLAPSVGEQLFIKNMLVPAT